MKKKELTVAINGTPKGENHSYKNYTGSPGGASVLYSTDPLLDHQKYCLWGVYHAYDPKFDLADVVQFCIDGNSCYLEHLIGDFAFILHDKVKDEWIAMRDRMGALPVYYFQKGEVCVFSTDPEEILAFEEVSGDPDPFWMHDYITGQVDEPEYTFYRDIKRIPIHHLLRFRDRRTVVEPYWSYRIPDRELYYPNKDDYLVNFRELIREAVVCRVPEMDRVGCEFSGGLDCTSIAGVILKECIGRERLYTYAHVRADNSVFSKTPGENDRVNEGVELLNLQHHRNVDRKNEGVLKLYQYAFDLGKFIPSHNFTVYSQDFVRLASEDGVKVMFSGWGGDQCISQRMTMRQYNMTDFNGNNMGMAKSLLFLRGLASRLKKQLKPSPFHWTKRLPHQLETIAHFSEFFPELKDIDSKARLLEKGRQKDRLNDPRLRIIKEIGLTPVIQRLEANYHLAGSYGIRYVYPYFDHRLIEFMLSLPLDIWLHPTIRRYMFKKAISKWLPPALANRTKDPANMFGWVMDAYLNDLHNDSQFKPYPGDREREFYRIVEERRFQGCYNGELIKEGLARRPLERVIDA